MVSSSSLLLANLELSDTQVYAPEIRALLGTAAMAARGGRSRAIEGERCVVSSRSLSKRLEVNEEDRALQTWDPV